jgi:hypothetical protein
MGGRNSPSELAVSLEEAQRIGSAVLGVVIAVSRKTKRKLPLARKTETACAFYAKNNRDIETIQMITRKRLFVSFSYYGTISSRPSYPQIILSILFYEHTHQSSSTGKVAFEFNMQDPHADL